MSDPFSAPVRAAAVISPRARAAFAAKTLRSCSLKTSPSSPPDDGPSLDFTPPSSLSLSFSASASAPASASGHHPHFLVGAGTSIGMPDDGALPFLPLLHQRASTPWSDINDEGTRGHAHSRTVRIFPGGSCTRPHRGRDFSGGPGSIQLNPVTGTYETPSARWMTKKSGPIDPKTGRPRHVNDGTDHCDADKTWLYKFDLDTHKRPPPGGRPDHLVSTGPIPGSSLLPQRDAEGRWVDMATRSRTGSDMFTRSKPASAALFQAPRSARLDIVATCDKDHLLAQLTARVSLRRLPQAHSPRRSESRDRHRTLPEADADADAHVEAQAPQVTTSAAAQAWSHASSLRAAAAAAQVSGGALLSHASTWLPLEREGGGGEGATGTGTATARDARARIETAAAHLHTSLEAANIKSAFVPAATSRGLLSPRDRETGGLEPETVAMKSFLLALAGSGGAVPVRSLMVPSDVTAGLSSARLEILSPRSVKFGSQSHTQTPGVCGSDVVAVAGGARRAIGGGVTAEGPNAREDANSENTLRFVGLSPRHPNAPPPVALDAAGGGAASEAANGLMPWLETSTLRIFETAKAAITPRTAPPAARDSQRGLRISSGLARGAVPSRDLLADYSTARFAQISEAGAAASAALVAAALGDTVDESALPSGYPVSARGRGGDPAAAAVIGVGGRAALPGDGGIVSWFEGGEEGGGAGAGAGAGAGKPTYSAPAALSAGQLTTLALGGPRGHPLRTLLGSPIGFTADNASFVRTDLESLAPISVPPSGAGEWGRSAAPSARRSMTAGSPNRRAGGGMDVGVVFSPLRASAPQPMRATRGRNDPEATRDYHGDAYESVNCSFARTAGGGAAIEPPPDATRNRQRSASVHTALRVHAGLNAGGAAGNSLTFIALPSTLGAADTSVAKGRHLEAALQRTAGVCSGLFAGLDGPERAAASARTIMSASEARGEIESDFVRVDDGAKVSTYTDAMWLRNHEGTRAGEGFFSDMTTQRSDFPDSSSSSLPPLRPSTTPTSASRSLRSRTRAPQTFSPLTAANAATLPHDPMAGQAATPAGSSLTHFAPGCVPRTTMTDIHSPQKESHAQLFTLYKRLDDMEDEARWAANAVSRGTVFDRLAPKPLGLRTTDVNPLDLFAQSYLGRLAMAEVGAGADAGAGVTAGVGAAAATARGASLAHQRASSQYVTLTNPASHMPAFATAQAAYDARLTSSRVSGAVPVDFSKGPPPIAPYARSDLSATYGATSLDGGAAATRVALGREERDANVRLTTLHLRASRHWAGGGVAGVLTHGEVSECVRSCMGDGSPPPRSQSKAIIGPTASPRAAALMGHPSLSRSDARGDNRWSLRGDEGGAPTTLARSQTAMEDGVGRPSTAAPTMRARGMTGTARSRMAAPPSAGPPRTLESAIAHMSAALNEMGREGREASGRMGPSGWGGTTTLRGGMPGM